MSERTKLSDRQVLLEAARWFSEQAAELEEVVQVALVGSLCTPKRNPHDVDLVVTVRPGADFKRLAKLGRSLRGRIQRGRLGADVFLVEDGRYIGRTCHYREPWPRVRCISARNMCDSERAFVCDTSRNFTLRREVFEAPPLVLYPEIEINADLPADVVECFGLPGNHKSP